MAHGSDLNPVAVLITKAMIEIPARFADRAPVNSDSREEFQTGGWQGAKGLADDLRYYGAWMRAEAETRIGHLYPNATLENGGDATVIAWLWARTVTCPNPACGAEMPLVKSFLLSNKKGKEAWIEPSSTGRRRRLSFRCGLETGPRRRAPSTAQGLGARSATHQSPSNMCVPRGARETHSETTGDRG